jgi:hypothetical protein
MFENQTARNRVHLKDGCLVRLDLRWHHKPIFIADLCGYHYNVAGHIYDLDGNPIGDGTPQIVEVVRGY